MSIFQISPTIPVVLTNKDGSKASENALRTVLSSMDKERDTLILISVARQTLKAEVLSPASFNMVLANSYHAKAEREASRILYRLGHDCQREGVFL